MTGTFPLVDFIPMNPVDENAKLTTRTVSGHIHLVEATSHRGRLPAESHVFAVSGGGLRVDAAVLLPEFFGQHVFLINPLLFNFVSMGVWEEVVFVVGFELLNCQHTNYL